MITSISTEPQRDEISEDVYPYQILLADFSLHYFLYYRAEHHNFLTSGFVQNLAKMFMCFLQVFLIS